MSVASSSALAINEIRIDQPGTDRDEYLELAGAPGHALDGLTYIVIGDGPGGTSGVIEADVDLAGQALDGDGLFLAAEARFTLTTADLVTTLDFENSDNVTHLLVEGFTGSRGQDLDADDDGTLDATPWTAIVDAVALIESTTSGEQVYASTVVGPDGRFVPAHVFRDPDLDGAFAIGTFDPVGGDDTPGALNAPAVAAFDLVVTEAWVGQEGPDLTADWFEIRNVGTVAWVAGTDPDLFYDDESSAPEEADLITGLTRLDPGERAIVLIDDAADAVATFRSVWGPVIDLTGVEIGLTDGAGLGQSGDAVTLFVGTPAADTIVDTAVVPASPSGIAYDVEAGAFAQDGVDGAVTTLATAGSDGTEPAIASPGNGAPIPTVVTLEVTEIWPGQAGADVTADWFEITNAGTRAWTAAEGALAYDDESAAIDDADPIQGLTAIAPGEKVVVVVGDAGDAVDFRTVWGEVLDLEGLQVGFTDGAGLGNGGDGVALFQGGSLVAFETYPDTQGNSGRSFDTGLGAFSTVGNANGAVATITLADGEAAIASPGDRAPSVVNPNAPVVTANAAATTAFLDVSGDAPRFAATIDDATDPAATAGIVLTIADADSDLADVTVTVASSNEAVVAAGGLGLTGTGAERTLTIEPAGVGSSVITVTATDGDGNSGTLTLDYRASAASSTPATSVFHTGNSDASAAVAVDADFMLVADDEDQGIQLVDRDRSGLPVAIFDVDAELAGGEVDIEGAVRSGDTVFWVGSHETDQRGKLFATTIAGTGADTTLAFAGAYTTLRAELAAWDATDGHGLGADALFAGNAFNIEGLTLQPGTDGTGYLGFRVPGVDGRALIVPVTNLTDLPGADAGTASFGAPILLDLGGRTIRDLETNGSEIAILAGPAAGAPDFRLFTWSGDPADAPVPFDSGVDLAAQETGGSPEAIVELPASAGVGTTLQIITDNGDTDWYGDGTASKDLEATPLETFRSDLVTLQPFTPPPAFTPFAESFEEEPGTTYTLSAPLDAGFDFFGRFPAPDTSNGARDDFTDGFDGSFAIFGQDQDGRGGDATRLITISDIATTGAEDVLVTIALGALASEPRFNNFETADGDGIEIFATSDGGARTLIGAFKPNGQASDLYEDTDLDGVGDGARLTTTLTDFGFLVENTGARLDIEIALTSTDSFEPIVVDNVRVDQATFDLQITEIWAGQDGADLTADWFEITNAGTAPWVAGENATLFYDDVSQDPADATPIEGLVRLDAGESAIVVVGTAADADIFRTVWSPDIVLDDVEIGWTDGAGLGAGSSGDGVTLFVGGPNAGTVADFEAYPEPTSGVSFDVEAGAFSVAGTGGAVETTATAGTSGEEPAVGSPGNGEAIVSGITLVSAVQGAGDTSPFDGQLLTIEAVVVGDFQGAQGLGGFYVQEEDTDADGDAATSEGLFIAEGATPLVDVGEGDKVRVQGRITEDGGETTLVASSVEVLSSGEALPTAAEVRFPLVGGQDDLEAFEGMRVTVPTTLFVTEYFRLDSDGEIRLSSDGPGNAPGTDGRLDQFTQFNAPSQEGFAQHRAEIAARSIVLDDGSDVQNPETLVFGRGGEPLSATNPLRGGDTVTGLEGVLGFGGGDFRIHNDNGADIQPTDARPEAPPEVGGRLQVAGFNVLNYFTTLDDGSQTDGGRDPRGADTAAELVRQTEKLVTALLALDADVVGLVELENSIEDEAIAAIVDALNTALGTETYAFVATPGLVGTDAITTGLIYKPEAVTPVGDVAILDDASFVDPNATGTDRNRPAVMQSFEEVGTGETFSVVVNHFKSKGSSDLGAGDASNPDSDQGDGQGFWNDTRTKAAEALVAWLATDPTGTGDTDVLIVGDINAYAQEDPIKAFEAAGFTDLAERFVGPSSYSFLFDGQFGTLDYGLASPSMLGQVTGAAEWHINAAEPDAIDYNLIDGRDPALFDGTTPFRSSDHDPLLVGLDLGTPLELVMGTGASERLSGTDGADRIEGLGGNDLLQGGLGDDVLVGGAGVNRLLGGDGADLFVLASGGRQLVYDFETIEDRIGLDGLAFEDLVAVAQRGSTVLQTTDALGGETLAFLRGVDADDLTDPALFVPYTNDNLVA